MESKIHIPIEVKRLDALASACKNAASDDFKELWYKKLIELAKKYKLIYTEGYMGSARIGSTLDPSETMF